MDFTIKNSFLIFVTIIGVLLITPVTLSKILDEGAKLETSNTLLTNQLPTKIPAIAVQADGVTIQTPDGFEISQANSFSNPTQSTFGATDITIGLQGEIKKVESAGKITTSQFFGIGVENVDLESGKMNNVIKLTDKSGFTLQNAQNAQVQVLHQTADIETSQGDYYQHREIVITTANHADISTPNKVLGFDVEKVYSTNDVLTFDRASTLILTNPLLPLDNLGQTRVLFDYINQNTTREIRTIIQGNRLMIPNPLSPPT